MAEMKRKRKRPGVTQQGQKKPKLEVLASQPSLSLLPDNIALKIMSYLDIPSMISLAKVNHRYYHLHLDEFIWTDVDLSTIPRLDVRKLKQLIREKLHHALWRITLRSNAVECQRHSSMRPIVTSSAVDELFQKCCTIRNIKLENVDLSQLPADCLLWSSSHLEKITFSRCIAPFMWLDKVKPHWPCLKQLYLPYTTKTSDHDLSYLASMTIQKHQPTLSHLSLKSCYRVGNPGVVTICDSFPNLLMLDISECSGITAESLLLIAEKMTELNHLDISNTVTMDSRESADQFLGKLQKNCRNLKLLTVYPAQLDLDEDSYSEQNIKLSKLLFNIESP